MKDQEKSSAREGELSTSKKATTPCLFSTFPLCLSFSSQFPRKRGKNSVQTGFVDSHKACACLSAHLRADEKDASASSGRPAFIHRVGGQVHSKYPPKIYPHVQASASQSQQTTHMQNPHTYGWNTGLQLSLTSFRTRERPFGFFALVSTPYFKPELNPGRCAGVSNPPRQDSTTSHALNPKVPTQRKEQRKVSVPMYVFFCSVASPFLNPVAADVREGGLLACCLLLDSIMGTFSLIFVCWRNAKFIVPLCGLFCLHLVLLSSSCLLPTHFSSHACLCMDKA